MRKTWLKIGGGQRFEFGGEKNYIIRPWEDWALRAQQNATVRARFHLRTLKEESVCEVFLPRSKCTTLNRQASYPCETLISVMKI